MAGSHEAITREEDPRPSASHSSPTTSTAPMPSIQRALAVGRSDDPLEREADQVADRVVRRLSTATSFPSQLGQTDSSRAVRSASARDRPAASPPTVSRLARSIHRRADISRSGSDTDPITAEGGSVGPDVERRITRARGGGAPLEQGIRRSMEDAFGADFSNVRVHRGPEPAALNDAVGARAFTIGSDIFFGASAPEASSGAGQHLLAHELTHTVQQGGAHSVARTIRRATEGEPEEAPATEEATESAPEEVVMEGMIAEVVAPEAPTPSTGPPPGLATDSGTAAPGRAGGRAARSAQSSAPGRTSTTYRINVSGVSGHAALRRLSTMPDGDESDKVAAKVATTAKLSSGATVSPFGALNSAYTTSKVKWKSKKPKKGDATIDLGFTLNLRSEWGTTDGGRTDVPSSSASVITADNYATVVSDLTPGAKGGSWVAPRTQFWSQKICERHEKFHYDDISTWFAKTGKQLVVDDLNLKTIAVSSTDDESAIEGKVNALVQGSINTITNAHIVHMNGTGQTYYNYPGEIRAFGDGKVPYETLAAGVKKHGEGLVAKRDKAAKKTSKV